MEPHHPKPEGDGQRSAGWQSGAQDKAADLSREAREAARSRVTAEAEQTMQTASRAVGDSAEALDQAAQTLNEQGHKTLAQTMASIASGLSDFSRRLESRNVDGLVQDITDLARRNPEMFVLGSVGAGFVLSRFFKASSSTRRH